MLLSFFELMNIACIPEACFGSRVDFSGSNGTVILTPSEMWVNSAAQPVHSAAE
jgi:hypothetical protein